MLFYLFMFKKGAIEGMYPVCYRIKIFNISRAIRAFSWQFLNVTKLFLEASLTYLHDDQACLIIVKIRKMVGNKLQKIKYRWENLTAVWSSHCHTMKYKKAKHVRRRRNKNVTILFIIIYKSIKQKPASFRKWSSHRGGKKNYSVALI